MAGQTYFLRLGGFSGATGNFTLSVSLAGTGLTPTITPTRTATATGSSSLTGSVAFQGRGSAGDPRWAVPLSVKLFRPGTSTLVMSAIPTATANGTFTVSGITPGTYDVEVKHVQSLSRRVNGVSIAAGDAASQSLGTLITGDVNGDNAVTILDFSLLSASFGLSQGQTGFDPRADLDANNIVDIIDFSLLSSSFGSGPSAAAQPLTSLEGLVPTASVAAPPSPRLATPFPPSAPPERPRDTSSR
jgi:hypothetical protein